MRVADRLETTPPQWRNNIRKMAGASSRQRQYPNLCFVLQNGVIRHQELRMIGRNVKHTGVGKWSWNDRGISAGDRSLHQELLRIPLPVLSVMYRREPSVKRLPLVTPSCVIWVVLSTLGGGRGRLSQTNIPPSAMTSAATRTTIFQSFLPTCICTRFGDLHSGDGSGVTGGTEPMLVILGVPQIVPLHPARPEQ